MDNQKTKIMSVSKSLPQVMAKLSIRKIEKNIYNVSDIETAKEYEGLLVYCIRHDMKEYEKIVLKRLAFFYNLIMNHETNNNFTLKNCIQK